MSDSLFPVGEEQQLPVLTLRNVVLFPAAVTPVNVGRLRSIRAVEFAQDTPQRLVVVACQKEYDLDRPGLDDLYPVATLARVLRVIRLSTGSYSVVVQGVCRLRLLGIVSADPFMVARVQRLPSERAHVADDDVELAALVAQVRARMREFTDHLPAAYAEQSEQALAKIVEPGALADVVSAYLPSNAAQKSVILGCAEVRQRLRLVLKLLQREIEVERVKIEVTSLVQEGMSETQRHSILRQQMRDIRRQLGEDVESESVIDALRDRLSASQPPDEIMRAAKRHLGRLHMIPEASPEYQLSKTYLEWLADLPWRAQTEDTMDVSRAARVLDEDHHGLERVKRRIIEQIAVRSLKPDARGPILCFVGPPGVGKTSLAKSIARATGRRFARVALGGVHDEGEIRGHRRTYVGAYPGRILSSLKTSKSRNPVIVLDEIDKLVESRAGSPAAALLEVLDPAQNDTFVDHYIEQPFDLSQVLFIATANQLGTIPAPLLDRLEVIELPGYTLPEKVEIAKTYLLPRVLSEHGLTPEQVDIDDASLTFLVEGYTREAGVRRLAQQLAALARDVAVQIAERPNYVRVYDKQSIRKSLGPDRGEHSLEKTPLCGVAVGLSVHGVGGDPVPVEASLMPGKGRVHLTGHVGDVMKESVAAAFSYIRAHASAFGLPPDFLATIDIHVHFSEGATPKDGPSLGLAVFVALLSLLTRDRVRHDVAFIGEVTLRGRVLEVQGLRERLLAAYTAGIRHVVMPSRNVHDLEELPSAVRAELTLTYVSRLTDVCPMAFVSAPAAA